MLIKLLLAHYVVMSLVSAAMHAADKRRAIRGKRRVPERSLHSMELVGGWPGAILTTRMIHHKTSKRSYMWTLYAIAALHALFWSLIFWFATRG
tara:strand:+ start:154972 stop:155253 length:282 start_codon:yes stop_codon:yes gene_type:complete